MTSLDAHRLLYALALIAVLWGVQLPHIRLWLLSMAIAFDRFFNTLLMGSCDETLSSRAWRADQDKRYPGMLMRRVIDALFLVLFSQKDHCQTAWQYEALRFRPEVLIDTAGIALSQTLRKS